MRKDWPRSTPTQYFNVSGEKGANRRNANKQIFMAKIILKYDIIELKNLLLKVKYATDALEKVRNQIALSNSTAGKCTSMQAIKQPEHGRISTIKEQK